MRGWRMKYLAKKALSGYVPDEILSRKKAGFPIPYDSWLRNSLRSWVSDLLLDPKAISRGYFKRNAIEELIRRNIQATGYPKDIFALVVLEIWHRTFVDQRSFELQSLEELAGANA